MVEGAVSPVEGQQGGVWARTPPRTLGASVGPSGGSQEALQVLVEAGQRIGERSGVHGTPERQLELIAKLWGAYLNTCVTPTDVANMMVLLKVARSSHAPNNKDNYVDMAGYAALAGEATT